MSRNGYITDPIGQLRALRMLYAQNEGTFWIRLIETILAMKLSTRISSQRLISTAINLKENHEAGNS